MTAIPDRQISISVTLAPNSQSGQPTSFAGMGGANAVNIQGLRTSVRIKKAYQFTATATVKIWGMSQSLMNQLSALGLVRNDVPKNQIAIAAGDSLTGMSTIFRGTIIAAYGEYENQPDVSFTMEAQAPGVFAALSATPSSFPQAFTVEEVMNTLAQKMGMTVNNFGVNTKLPPMYVSGAPAVQVRKIVDAARIDVGVDDLSLDLTTKNGSRSEAPITVSPDTGMIAYPAFAGQYLMVKMIFNPQVKFKSTLNVQSSVLSQITAIKNLAGAVIPSQWTVQQVDLDLDVQVPKGQWMTTAYGVNPQKADAVNPPTT
jgi:hypothetical protein